MTEDEWYLDGYIMRRRKKIWVRFWDIFMAINLIAIVVFLVILVWAFFDIRERVGYMLAAQVPPIVMMVIRRICR